MSVRVKQTEAQYIYEVKDCLHTIVADMSDCLSPAELSTVATLICGHLSPVQLQTTVLNAEDDRMIVHSMCDRLSAGIFNTIIAHMAAYLSADQLKLALLNAIPERQEHSVHLTAPTRRPGLPQRTPTGPPTRALIYDQAYSDQFPDPDALEFLEEIRGVVHGIDPARDPGTLKFLLDEFDPYFDKQSPAFFQPILILFKEWSKRSGAPAPHTHDAVRGPPNARGSSLSILLNQLYELNAREVT